jgi:hypothetical protein
MAQRCQAATLGGLDLARDGPWPAGHGNRRRRGRCSDITLPRSRSLSSTPRLAYMISSPSPRSQRRQSGMTPSVPSIWRDGSHTNILGIFLKGTIPSSIDSQPKSTKEGSYHPISTHATNQTLLYLSGINQKNAELLSSD